MADKQWKAVERRHAKDLQGFRIGSTRGTDMPDSVSDLFAVESKSRDELPSWLKGAVLQAHKNKTAWEDEQASQGYAAELNEDFTAVVILHENGTKFESDLVVLNYADFLRLVERLKK